MSSKSLVVAIAGRIAGSVEQRESGQLVFRYDPAYRGAPLSISMPVGNRTYHDKQIRPFLCGLLPDDFQVRRNTALEFGVSGNNPFALLSFVGLDCPGAVQLCPPEAVDALLSREESIAELGDDEIAMRLRLGRTDADAAWVAPAEHWSLGGQQSKFALRLANDAWCSCSGAAATTHIFKCGIGGLAYQALNEYLCLKLAASCGLPSVRVSYREFSGEPAIIVERYDRQVNADGGVTRFHQEDFCQALGVLPENKYPEYGGPAAADIVRVLQRTGQYAEDNLNRFTAMLFFNYLVGAPDANAKNYSLLLAENGEMRLAPLYDVASVLPYRRPRETQRIAMGIGGENRLGRVGRGAIERYADSCGLSAEDCTQLMRELAQMIPARFAEVLDREASIPGVSELRDRWENPLAMLCTTTLGNLDCAEGSL